jgi:hypothetical protein
VRGKILLFSALLLAVAGLAGLALLIPFTTNSTVTGYQYRVNTLQANWYLTVNGYNKKYNGIKISLVDQVQTGYQHTGKDKMVFKSVSAITQGDDLVMTIQYDPVQRENYESGNGGGSYTRDLYMYLCLALQGNNPQPNDCYRKADLQIARERWLPGKAVELVKQDETSWSLVGRVHAQACAGTIPCGGLTTAGYCSDNVTQSCMGNDECNSGSCIGGGQSSCNTSLNNINCKTLTDKAQCETQGYVSSCNIKCNTSAENFCSWGGTGGGCKSNQVCCSANSCGGGGGRDFFSQAILSNLFQNSFR